MTTEAPRVSVVIPTRSRPDLVTRAVRSVLDQTLRDFEIIVVVDGHDPQTVACLSDIADPRLHVITNDQSRGASAARNAGVQAARAEVVAFLDDDDEWLPRKLEMQLSIGMERGNDLIRICQVVARTPSADYIWPRRAPAPNEHVSEYLFVRKSAFAGEGKVQTSMICAPRKLLIRVPFDEGLGRYQEADWVLRAVHSGAQLVLVPRPLAIWHTGDGRDSITTRHAGDWREAMEWIIARRSLVTARAYSAFLLVRVSSIAVASGDRRALLEIWREARRGQPGLTEILLFLGKAVAPPSLRSQLRRRFSSDSRSRGRSPRVR